MLSKEYGITIIISSHVLGEIEQVADTIAVLSEGKLIQEVSMSSVREMNTDYIEIETKTCQKAVYVLEKVLKLQNFKVIGAELIRIYDNDSSQSEISKALVMNEVSIESMIKKKTSLEEYFLKLVRGDRGDV